MDSFFNISNWRLIYLPVATGIGSSRREDILEGGSKQYVGDEALLVKLRFLQAQQDSLARKQRERTILLDDVRR